MARLDWVRLPTNWIVEERGLLNFRWQKDKGANNVAALMTLIVLAHHADDNGTGELIYDQICAATGLSRSKVSGGLVTLAAEQIVVRKMNGRSTYRLEGYQRNRGWGKLPARGLYDGNRIAAFDHFHLRRDTELNALKLYLLFVAMRNNALNVARIGYEKIREYTGIRQNKITAALSFLTSVGLVYVEAGRSRPGERPTAHAYRLVHLDPYRHPGTTRRGDSGEIDHLEEMHAPAG
jgi:DNA-binding transcriptional ArsR family regulator